MSTVPSDIGKPARKGGFMTWLNDRFPFTQLMEEHITKYYASKNLTWWYVFGVLSMVVLVLQLVTGIFLTMNYKPSAADAFSSVEYIMRDVEWGWLMRYLHSTGASFFFIVVYLHMFRGMMYGSYQKPRELIWILGMLIYLCLAAEAFFGYLLPWGQMSYWGAQVIVSLAGAIPVVGDGLVEWVRGDFFISDITLNRFFALHVVAVPLILVALVALHIIALHHVGSTSPDGVEIKENKESAGKSIYTAIRAIDSLKILFAPVLPFTCEKLHHILGYEKPLFGEQYTETVEDNLGTHTVLRYREGDVCCEWVPSGIEAGQPFNQPQPLFQKLDPELAEEEIERLG